MGKKNNQINHSEPEHLGVVKGLVALYTGGAVTHTSTTSMSKLGIPYLAC